MKFFVSYAREDRHDCTHVVNALESRACGVSYDTDMPPGPWAQWIEQEIKDCDCFIALLSPDSATSSNCRKEWKLAVSFHEQVGRPLIVPLLVRDVAIPPLLRNWQVNRLAVGELPDLVRKVRTLLIPRIREFWGKDAFRQTVRLVVATRECREIEWKTFAETPQGARPETPYHWLATQDIRAAVYLANAVARFSGHGVEVLHDYQDHSQTDDHCTIALGLGFNQLTHDRSNAVAGLYRIGWGPSNAAKLECTDHFAIGAGDLLEPKDGLDVALLARLVLPKGNGDRAVHFVCAGRTAHGTATAGYFLAERWEEVADLYRDPKLNLDLSSDSLAIALWHPASTQIATVPVTLGHSITAKKEDDKQGALQGPLGQVVLATGRARGISPAK